MFVITCLLSVDYLLVEESLLFLFSISAQESYKTLMTVIYCISGIVSLFIFIFVITVLVQKCCTHKPSTLYVVHDSGAEEAMIESEQPRPQVNSTAGAHGTELASISRMRHNGAINRDNELENYPIKGSTRELPPRYSQLDNAKPSAPPVEAAAMSSPPVMPLLEPDPPLVLPPSYEEVVKEKQTESI